MISSGVRLPELDGLRAIAVALVIVGHAGTKHQASPSTLEGFLIATIGNAALGVQLFFVLSGFLITSLLLREQEISGGFRLGAFYVRRARRILPAFFAYIVAIGLMSSQGWLNIDLSHFIAAITQTWNYQLIWIGEPHSTSGIWYFGHYWSLSLEEQYYLLWPLTLILLPRRFVPFMLLCLALLMPFMRVGWYYAFPEHRGALGMFFHTASDSLMWGSLLAFLMRDPPAWLLLVTGRLRTRLFVLVAMLVVQPLAAAAWGGAWTLPFGISLNALTSTYVLATLRCHSDWRPALSLSPLVFVGGLSYSLYIWQQLFLAPEWAQGPTFPLWIALPLLFFVALASWRFIERPFLGGTHIRVQPES